MTTPTGDHAETTASSRATDLPYGVAPPRYRLPAATRLGRVRLQVSDLARSLEFYEGLLGFRVLRRADGERRAATLGTHGEEGRDTPLVELVERAGARAVPRRGRLGLFHFAILLPTRVALGGFLRHLAAVDASVGMADHAVSEALYLQDPDGLGIEVYADRPRDTWRHEGRELYMTTEPLDVHGLVRAGGEAPWSGMPAGTTIGHVHLHVGDLFEGAAFYHEALGFDKVVWNYPGALFLSAGGYHHHLGTNTWAARAPRPEEGDARLLDWEVVVPDAAEAERAAASLRESGRAAVADDEGGWRVEDPWGTVVRIVGG